MSFFHHIKAKNTYNKLTHVLVLFQIPTIPQSYFDNNFKRIQESADQAARSQTIPNYLPQSPTPTPFPHLVAHDQTEQQMIQIISQIQSGHFTGNQAVFAYLAFALPLPDSIRMTIYSFLTHLPIPQLTPLGIILFFCFLPIVLVTLVLLCYTFLPRIVQTIVGFIGSRFTKESQDKTFLELTFPHNTSKSAYATEQLYNLIHTLSRRKKSFFTTSHPYSLEIVATKEQGIRYILAVPTYDTDVIHKSVLSYLPGLKVQEVPNFLPSTGVLDRPSKQTSIQEQNGKIVSMLDVTLSQDFVLPLTTQKLLQEHDPMDFLTGTMTKLEKGETLALQIVVSPTLRERSKKRIQEIRTAISSGTQLDPLLNKKSIFPFDVPHPLFFILSPILWSGICVLKIILFIVTKLPYLVLSPNGPVSKEFFTSNKSNKTEQLHLLQLNPYEAEKHRVIKEKLGSHLFETSIRFLLITKTSTECEKRVAGFEGFLDQFSSEYQSLTLKRPSRLHILSYFSLKHLYKTLHLFHNRLLSSNTFVLSSSELADLYHFPSNAYTEGLIKHHSNNLPTPLSLHKDIAFDVIVGNNTYGGKDTPIGLITKQREKHMALFGGTGNGKSTMYHSMIMQDIMQGRGVFVLDPHGDLSNLILSSLPKHRKQDVILINPDDIEYPVGINILETTPNLSQTQRVKEQQFVTDSTISVFRRIFADDVLLGHAHRIENMLRNTIQTSFLVENRTLLTLYDLLEDQTFRNSVIKQITDQRLKTFWLNEFKKAGDYQRVKMISPVTARLGKFLFSPFVKRMIEQDHSTINFQTIMDEGKIVICNLSRGNIGEDTSETIGIMLLAKLQLAAMKRASISEDKRNPFYVYIDEFQYFATKSFVDMITSLRKYKVFIHVAMQSHQQLPDPKLADIMLSNIGVLATFRSASPKDEELIYPLFTPYVKKGEILNLPQYHFFMKLSATTPEEPLSGVTIPHPIPKNSEKIERIISLTRENYAKKYEEPTDSQEKVTTPKPQTKLKKARISKTTNGNLKQPKKTTESKPNAVIKLPIQQIP